MNVRKTDEFIADVEHQYEWYVIKDGWELADRYLNAVEAASHLLAQHPLLGPVCRLKHPRLREWRFLLVAKPFKKHIIFYNVADDHLVLRRVMHGQRDLEERLLEPPGAG